VADDPALKADRKTVPQAQRGTRGARPRRRGAAAGIGFASPPGCHECPRAA
jgi:hypothetical protein